MIIDVESIAKWNMHPALYRVKTWAWVKAFISPFKTLYTSFKQYETDTDRLLRPNNQTIVQVALLNDLYDATLRRINIVTEGDELPDNYLYNRAELSAPETLVLFNRAETGPTATLYNRADYNNLYDFTVLVPTALSAQERLIRITVERYRLAGVQYRIVYT